MLQMTASFTAGSPRRGRWFQLAEQALGMIWQTSQRSSLRRHTITRRQRLGSDGLQGNALRLSPLRHDSRWPSLAPVQSTTPMRLLTMLTALQDALDAEIW